MSTGGVALTEWEMGTVGCELALGCDGWIVRCLNGRAGPAAIITQWVGYSRRTVGVMERGC